MSLPTGPFPEEAVFKHGTVTVKRCRHRLVTLGRELDGGKIRSGSGKWNGFEIFQSHYARTGDCAFYVK
jgi:hypothetical protein